MISSSGAPLAIGFGNPLLGDDAVGLRVIEELRRLSARDPGSLPPDTRLVAAGAPSTDLLPVLCDASVLLLIDAVDDGRPPGSIAVMRDAQVDATVGRGEISELLVAMRLTGHAPEAVGLVGIQVSTMAPGVGLSAPVGAAVVEAARVTSRELAALDARLTDSRMRRTSQLAGEVYA
jgi:hydrogenase maturation protease